jgi:AcrR family transcriptional regulator
MDEKKPQAGRRKYHHGDLRRALLDAAEEELSEQGLEGFSLRGCAKRAGVSHAAPAHHFKDASGLLAALASEAFERFHQTIARRMAEAPHGDTRARLTAAGLGYYEFAQANPALLHLIFNSRRLDFSSDPDLQRTATAAFDQLVDAVAAQRGDEPLASPEGRVDVAATWALVHGLSELSLAGRLNFLRDTSGEIPQDTLVHMMTLLVPDGDRRHGTA